MRFPWFISNRALKRRFSILAREVVTLRAELETEKEARAEAEERLANARRAAVLTIDSLRKELSDLRSAAWASELRARTIPRPLDTKRLPPEKRFAVYQEFYEKTRDRAKVLG